MLDGNLDSVTVLSIFGVFLIFSGGRGYFWDFVCVFFQYFLFFLEVLFRYILKYFFLVFLV